MKRVAAAALLWLASGAGSGALADARLLVVSGVGGEEVYSRQFNDWSGAMLDAARYRLGLAARDVLWLCESPAASQGRCAGESRREAVIEAVSRLARGGADDAPLMILLIGHGTARDGRALFNLPGPDLAAEDLGRALDDAGERPVAVVNTTAASAPFLPLLARPGRVVVTATAHAAEDDHTRFAGAFVAAWSGSEADADRDGRVSLLEAFRFASRAVARDYTAARQLVTEHATLDDDGDGRGTREADLGTDAAAGDGAFAARFHLAALPRAVSDSPGRMALETQARALVSLVADLRRARAAMAPERYEAVLESLLVALALNRRAAREWGT